MKKLLVKKKTNKARKGPKTKTGKAVVKRVKKYNALPINSKRRQLRVGGALLLVELFILVIILFETYQQSPGIIERDSVVAVDRGLNYIELEWNETRNTNDYVLMYRRKEYTDEETGEVVPAGEWQEQVVESQIKDDDNIKALEHQGEVIKMNARLDNLEESKIYEVKLRAYNNKDEGYETEPKSFATKLYQKINAHDYITKTTANRDFSLKATANTKLSYKSSNEEVASVNKYNGRVEIQGPGTTTITVVAEDNAFYVGTKKKIELSIFESEPVEADGAKAKIIGYLDSENCDVIKTVKGQGGIHVPQGLAYTGDKYIIAYGMSDSQRIISFDVKGDDKSVSVPEIALGHPNGFTYSPELGLCYCVKGYSTRAVTYNPKTDEYGTVNFKYGLSGIAYDRIDKVFYAASRTGMRVYSGDGEYTCEKYVGVVSHSGYTYTQDIGGHAGIMMRCLSSSNKHGTNYVDLYDMRNGNYLGTFSCALSEVESAAVDDDGYMLLLGNNSSRTDYIWNTHINIEDISEGLRSK